MRIQETFQLQALSDWVVHLYVLAANARPMLRQFDIDFKEYETVVDGNGQLDVEGTQRYLISKMPARYHATVTPNYNNDGKLRVAIFASPDCTKAGFGLSLLLVLGETFRLFNFNNAPISSTQMIGGSTLWSIILDPPNGLDANQCCAVANQQIAKLDSWVRLQEAGNNRAWIKSDVRALLSEPQTDLGEIVQKLAPLDSINTEFETLGATLSLISENLNDTKKLVSDKGDGCDSNFAEILALLAELNGAISNIKNLVSGIKDNTSIVISGNESNLTSITEGFASLRDLIDQLRQIDFESLKETITTSNSDSFEGIKQRFAALSDTLIAAFDGTADTLLTSDADMAKAVTDANANLSNDVHEKLEEAKAAITAVGTSITASVTNLLNIVTSAYKSWLSEAETIADKETYLTVALQNFRENFQTVQNFTETFKEFLNELNSFSSDLDSVASLEASILSRVPALSKLDELLTNKSKIESGRLALDVVKTIDDVKRTFTKEKKLVL
jgi:hypothetical protein